MFPDSSVVMITCNKPGMVFCSLPFSSASFLSAFVVSGGSLCNAAAIVTPGVTVVSLDCDADVAGVGVMVGFGLCVSLTVVSAVVALAETGVGVGAAVGFGACVGKGVGVGVGIGVGEGVGVGAEGCVSAGALPAKFP